MHELRRRSYLDSMGIDSYISRSQLPGAAATQRLVISRCAPATDVSPTIAPETSTIPLETNTATAFREAAKPVKAQLDTVKTPPASPVAVPPPAAAVPAFSIVAIIAGGYLWIEALSQSEVSRDQIFLIRAMIKALGLAQDALDVSQFDWPIHNNTQLDQGEDAARAALGGFVQRKVGQQGCRGLIFLGSACQQKLDTTQLELGSSVSTVGTLEMLRDPQLKKRAWEDLLPLSNRS